MIQDDQVRALYRRAQALVAAARFNDALTVLRGILASEPDAGEAHCLAAQCLLMLGQSAKANNEAAVAVGCDPEAAWPHRIRSVALAQLSNRPAALEAVHEAIRLAPNDFRGHTQLAEILARAGKRKPALESARNAVELSPEVAAPHVSLSFVALLAGRWSECEQAARRALQIQPDSAIAMNNLGVALRHRRRHLLALSLFSRGASTDPTQPMMRGNINAVFLSITGLATGLALSTIVLVALLVNGATHRAGTPVATALAAIAGGSFLALLWFGRAWYHQLPRAARNSVRDLRSWAATFNDPGLTRRGLIGKLVFAQLFYALVAGAFLLIAVAAVYAIGGSGPDQPHEVAATLFWIGVSALGYFGLLRWVARRNALRTRHARFPVPPPVDVEWP